MMELLCQNSKQLIGACCNSLKPATKSNTPLWVFLTIFKLCKWQASHVFQFNSFDYHC